MYMHARERERERENRGSFDQIYFEWKCLSLICGEVQMNIDYYYDNSSNNNNKIVIISIILLSGP